MFSTIFLRIYLLIFPVLFTFSGKSNIIEPVKSLKAMKEGQWYITPCFAYKNNSKSYWMRIAIKKTTTKDPHEIEVRHYNNHNEVVNDKRSNSNCSHLSKVKIKNKNFENKKYPKEWPSEGVLRGGWYRDGKYKLKPLSGVVLDGAHPSMGSKTKPVIQLLSGKKSIKLV